MATVVKLDDERAGYVASLVRDGRVASADEAVRLGIDLLREQNSIAIELSADDRAALNEGFAQLDAGEGLDAEDVFADLRKRFGSA